MYIYYQPNPCGRSVGDCAVRAISAALDLEWNEAFDILAKFAKNMCDMPSSDQVWGAVLRANGFYKNAISTYCHNCYTIEEFCKDIFNGMYPSGIYVLSIGGHVTTVIDGDIYDSWDTSKETPVYYWYKPYMKGETNGHL